MEQEKRVLDTYEENLLGIPVIIKDAVIYEVDAAGDEIHTIPDMEKLISAAAMARALLPIKLNGSEIRFLRKALEMPARELAENMDVAPETVSRWENDGQTMGGFSEKGLRQLVCALLHKKAPAIDYDPEMIARMKIRVIRDPNMRLELRRITLKSDGAKSREWDSDLKAA